MERRSEPRVEADQPVQVTVLGSEEGAFSGRIGNLSGRGMRLLLDRSVPLDAAVRVEWNDTLALGEVCYAKRHGDVWAVGLMLEHSLPQLAELDRLIHSILGEESPSEQPAEVPSRAR